MKDSQKKNNKTTKKEKLVGNKQPEHIVLTEKTSSIWFILPLISLLIIFLLLVVYNMKAKEELSSYTLRSHVSTASVSAYPLLKEVIAPNITAESAIILDAHSKAVLYEKNAQVRFSMASTTKIMTALTGIEHFRPHDILSVYTSNVEGVNVGFQVGEKMYFKDVLYAMMLASGNDAAYAMADNYTGGVPAFIARMNQKAEQYHLSFTHYADPAGLDDDGNYTTARDLALLAAIAIKNDEFARVISTKETIVYTTDRSHQFVLKNLNKLLGQYGVNGVKTGTTEGAGQVLVTSTTQNGRTFIIVIMKSQDRFADTEVLLSLLSKNITYITHF
jgi:serine-type D-Ala-D-Ala carboxypeptidase (penicillin-binding protein 5/6)